MKLNPSNLDQCFQLFTEEGYFILPQFFDKAEIKGLQERIDQIMLGTADVDYDQIWMQLDTDSGKYDDLSWGGNGFQGATLDYRKIQGLEADQRFLDFITSSFFVKFCGQVYGPNVSITSFRTMFMNKAAGKGTWLPWHQDRWNFLDQDPLLTVWIPLDTSTIKNGCVQIIRRSHRKGLINPEHSSGFLTESQAAEHAPIEDIVPILVEPGDLVVLHNHLLHASDKNRTSSPRRALSVCYMNGHTKNITEPEVTYPRLFNT